jgi:MFS transporter, MFS domain-containing protein family, molybdate-anion transporter
LFYGFFYIFSCLTKHFPNFYILISGRISGGIATSILFSTFESWMISEHFSRNFSSELLDYTFFLQVFGNGIIAILSGLLGNFVRTFFNSSVAPFDAAIIFLIIGVVLIQLNWVENYGSSDQNSGFFQNFQDAFIALKNDPKIICLGISQSFFEASMYAFVFMWTPTLELHFKNIPHGLVFAIFMVSVMIGSSIYKSLSNSFVIHSL